MVDRTGRSVAGALVVVVVVVVVVVTLLVGARVRTVVTGPGVLRGENDESPVESAVDMVTVVSTGGGLEDGLLPDGRLAGELFTTSGLLFVLGLTLRLRVTVTAGI